METRHSTDVPEPKDFGLDEAALEYFQSQTKPFIILPSLLGWLSFFLLLKIYPLDIALSWSRNWLLVPLYFLPGVAAGAGINSLRRLYQEKRKTRHKLYPNYVRYGAALTSCRDGGNDHGNGLNKEQGRPG
jgi:hypothetical protein